MDNKKYIERIKNLREDHDYTQEYVANYLGTSQTMYARYERGANEFQSAIFYPCANCIMFPPTIYLDRAINSKSLF